MHRYTRLLLCLLLFITATSCNSSSGSVEIFEITIENISTQSTLIASNGTAIPVIFSTAVWCIHSDGQPIFTEGEPERGNGLRQLAEDGDPSALVEPLQFTDGVSLVGLVTKTQEGRSLLSPGETYSFQVAAQHDTRLSFASMFVQSNDVFISFRDTGLPLFDSNGSPVSGDFTSELFLFDAGTEVNEEPGLGANQAPRQAEPGAGVRENGLVRHVDDGFTYPDMTAMLRVTISPTQAIDYDY